MEKAHMNTEVKKYLSDQFFCSALDLEQDNTIYTINKITHSPYIKIMTYNQCVVVCTSQDIHSSVKSALSGKNKDEIFEFPFVYGQTIHYIPDVNHITEPTLTNEYTYELLEEDELYKLNGITGFDHSLTFDNEGNTSTKIVLLAKKKDEIIGLAGAGAETSFLWEVGVDVNPKYRKDGLGTNLVRSLTIEIMKRGMIPFYSASITNIGSQMVAGRSGYFPCWIDTYGTILDGSSVYSNFVKELKL